MTNETPTPAQITSPTLDLVADLVTSAQVPEPVPESDQWVSFVVPIKQRLHLVDVAALNGEPRHATGTTVFDDPADLAHFVRDYLYEGTQVYTSLNDRTITAVIDGDIGRSGDTAIPGRRAHRGVCTLNQSQEIKAITAASGKYMSQEEFAEWLEQWGHTIIEPDAATMMELALTIEQTSSAEFRSGARLTDGQRQLTYVETLNARAGTTGQITIPSTITFAAAPFRGLTPTSLEPLRASLRYRIRDGRLVIGFVVIRAQEWLDAAFAAMTVELRRAMAEIDVPVWAATPPPPAAVSAATHTSPVEAR